MIFRNTLNDATEVVSMPVVGALVFGIFYFLFSGLWLGTLFYLIAAIIVGVIFGDGTLSWVAMIVVWIGFAIYAPHLIRRKFLMKGWREVTDIYRTDSGPRNRKCPHCAELILAEASKCKHCGSPVDPIPTANDPYARDAPVSVSPPNGLPINEHIDRVVAIHRAKRKGDSYQWDNQGFSSFSELVEAINRKITLENNHERQA